MLTIAEWIALGFLAAYGISGLYWVGHYFISNYLYNKRAWEREIEEALANRPLVVNVVNHFSGEEKKSRHQRKINLNGKYIERSSVSVVQG